VLGKQKLQNGCVSLQKDTLQRFSGDDPVVVWLFIIDAGHVRVYSNSGIRKIVDVDKLNIDVLSLLTRQEREEQAALRFRLVQTRITGRRLALPAEIFDLTEEHDDRSHVWLDQSSPHLEIYTASHAQRVRSIPPSRLISESE
jgi:hypothetical protein